MTKRDYIFPALDPSLDDFKAHIRVTSDDLDSELTNKLVAAIRSAEHMIGKVIALSRFTFTGSFRSVITFPERPFRSVVSVKVDDVVLSEDRYTVSGRTLVFAEGVTGSTVEVVYKAGMKSVEYDIKAAILLHAAALFANPVDSVETMPKASTNLLRPYRSWGEDDGED